VEAEAEAAAAAAAGGGGGCGRAFGLLQADPRRISAVRERAASRQLIIAGVAFVRKRVPERPSRKSIIAAVTV